MELVEFQAPRGVRLAGALRGAGGAAALVVLAHGFGSDRTSRGRFPLVADLLARRGIASLAFDFGGCGESADDLLTPEGLDEDLAAAVAYARGRGYRRLGLLGHSLGGLVALRAAAHDPGLAALALTGAPTGPMTYDWQALFSFAQLRGLAAEGRLLLRPETGPRREVAVSRALLDAFGAIDPDALLPGVRCPTLLVCGDGDAEERQILAHARAALPRLPAGSTLEVIRGAPHGFGAAYPEVGERVAAWFGVELR